MTESQGVQPLQRRRPLCADPGRVDAGERHEPAADADQLSAILAALTASPSR